MKNKIIKKIRYFFYFFSIFLISMGIAYFFNDQQQIQYQYNKGISYKEKQQYQKAYEVFTELQGKKLLFTMRKKVKEELENLEIVAKEKWIAIKEDKKNDDIRKLKRSLDQYTTVFAYSEKNENAQKGLQEFYQYEQKQNELWSLNEKKEKLLEKKQNLETLFSMTMEIEKINEKVFEYFYNKDSTTKKKALQYLKAYYKVNEKKFIDVEKRLFFLKKFFIEEGKNKKELEDIDVILFKGYETILKIQEISLGNKIKEKDFKEIEEEIRKNWELYIRNKKLILNFTEKEIESNKKEIYDINEKKEKITKDIQSIELKIKESL